MTNNTSDTARDERIRRHLTADASRQLTEALHRLQGALEQARLTEVVPTAEQEALIHKVSRRLLELGLTRVDAGAR